MTERGVIKFCVEEMTSLFLDYCINVVTEWKGKVERVIGIRASVGAIIRTRSIEMV